MYIEFEGVAGTGGADFGLLGEAPELVIEGDFVGVDWLLSLLTPSGFAVGGGGGNGEIEIDETLAE